MSKKYRVPIRPVECEFLDMCQQIVDEPYFIGVCTKNLNDAKLSCQMFQALGNVPRAWKKKQFMESHETVRTR